MPRAPKVKAEEGDVKPYDQVESPKKKSPAKAAGGAQKWEGPWTPDQAWALFNALYKKGKREDRFADGYTVLALTNRSTTFAENGVNWAAVSERVGRAPKVSHQQR
jgi:hypothetical protein